MGSREGVVAVHAGGAYEGQTMGVTKQWVYRQNQVAVLLEGAQIGALQNLVRMVRPVPDVRVGTERARGRIANVLVGDAGGPAPVTHFA